MIAWLVASAFAQDLATPEIDVDTWLPAIDNTAMMWTERSGFDQGLMLGLGAGWVDGPLVYTPPGGGEPVRALADAVGAHLIGSYGVGRARLAVDAPVYLLATGASVGSGAGLGDLSLDGKLRGPTFGNLGLAVTGRLTAPTSTLDAPLGDRGFGGELAAVADTRVGDVVLAGNLGARFRPRQELGDLVVDDQLVARLGASWLVRETWGVSGEIAAMPVLASFGAAETSPVEATLGLWGRLTESVVVRGGLGRGLTRGLGSPEVRGTVFVGWSPRVRDEDLDGVVADACPLDAEDVDGFEDGDGCPELDNDRDGIADGADRCPLEPEDRDAWHDDDGCIDPKTLFRISVIDESGAPVPGSSIAVAGQSRPGPEYAVELDPGVFEIAISADGYMGFYGSVLVPSGAPVAVVKRLPALRPGVGAVHLDVFDPEGRPVTTARWMLGVRTPEDLRSGSGLAVLPAGSWPVTVSAPDYASAMLGVDVQEARVSAISVVLEPFHVKLTAERLQLAGDVRFAAGTAELDPESYAILDEVASVLKQRPEIRRLRVEAHTDSRGAEAANQAVSEQRAAAVVKFLVDKGVPADRLSGAGYGESRPIDPADTPEAWAKNRRVEFVIERMAQ